MSNTLTSDFASILALPWLEILLRIGIAVLVGGAIGIEREYKNRPAGMRTHVLVCLGSTMIALLECILQDDLMASGIAGNVTLSVGRMSAQVVSGIGFLGAGTIFIAQKKIAGLTTAASLWNVACLGLAIGYGHYAVAVVGCVIVIVVLTVLQRIIHVNAIKRVEITFVHRAETLNFINQFFEEKGVKILDIDFQVETLSSAVNNDLNMYTNLYTLHLPAKFTYIDIVTQLSEHPGIQTVRTRNT